MKKVIVMTLIFVFIFSFTALVYAKPIDYKFITINEYQKVADQSTLIDVRSINSRNKSKLVIPGEVWINPYSGPELAKFIAASDKDKPYTVFCSCVDDNYSIRTAQLLAKNGFKNVNVLKDGWDSIVKSGLPTVPLREGENQ